jgi:hypothetical protein
MHNVNDSTEGSRALEDPKSGFPSFRKGSKDSKSSSGPSQSQMSRDAGTEEFVELQTSRTSTRTSDEDMEVGLALPMDTSIKAPP